MAKRQKIKYPLKEERAIYKITCNANGKVYIGASWYVGPRINIHKNSLLRGKHYNLELQNDYNKYGLSSFKYEVVEYLGNGYDLQERERYYIELYKATNKENGYNCNFSDLRSAINKQWQCKKSQSLYQMQ
jgi:group I intron endonuclease